MTDLSTLPPEIRALIEQPEEQKQVELQGLGILIAKLRDEAIEARRESGIETQWMDAEEAYVGIDDMNRAEFSGAHWAKPMSMEGSLIAAKGRNTDQFKATAFINETRRYVDAGASKVCEIAIPVDGKLFTLRPTPVPEMADAENDDTPAEQVTGQPMPGQNGQPLTVADLADHMFGEAEKMAEKAANRINDWMVEYKHAAELRKVIFDAARIGVGIIKGPIPEMRKATAVRKLQDGSLAVEMVVEIKPAARWLDPWCFYPAPGCGEDIHKGGYCCEVDTMLKDELLAMRDQAAIHFIPAAVEKVAQEGPIRAGETAGKRMQKPHKSQFEVWHFHGAIERTAFAAANPDQAKELDNSMDKVFAIVTLVNNTVIRAVQSPLDSGRLPYHVFCWSRRAGHWTGVGIGEQVRTPQRVLNAATRAMLNNAGKSSGAQVVMDPNAVEPADTDTRIVGDKLWYLRNGATTDDVRKVFAAFNWPNTTAQLMTVVDFALKMFEEQSNIPLVTQGQSGKTTPDTFSGQQLQDNNANQLLRSVGYALNDQITTPLVDMFYEWLMLDEGVPNDEKGDYKVDTSGALALIEKAMKDKFFMSLLGMDPMRMQAFGIDPRKVFAEAARVNRLAPAEVQHDEETQKKIDSQPPPPPVEMQVAQLRAASAEKIAQSRDQLAGQKNQNDLDRDTAYNNSLSERARTDRELGIEELRLKLRILETQERMSLQDAKVKVFDTTAKLQVQKELSAQDIAAALHKHHNPPPVITPPTEPAGRAQDGQAFEA